MKSTTFIRVIPPIKLPSSQRSSSAPTPEETKEPTQTVEMESQEQLEPVVITEALLETPRDESVYGSGWSLTELLNEFNER
jgi:hypothetical protein